MHLGAYYLCVILGYKLLAAVFQDYWIGFPPGHCQTGRSCPSMRHSRKRSSFLLFLSALVALMGPAVSRASAATYTWNAGSTRPTWIVASNRGGIVQWSGDTALLNAASCFFVSSFSSPAGRGGIWSTGSGALTIAF